MSWNSQKYIIYGMSWNRTEYNAFDHSEFITAIVRQVGEIIYIILTTNHCMLCNQM